MKNHHVLIRPVITEKTTLLKEKGGELCFQVHPAASKLAIRQALEESFDVQVASIRTVRVRGKFKRQGRSGGYRPDRKKAYVRLAEGSKTIEYFDL